MLAHRPCGVALRRKGRERKRREQQRTMRRGPWWGGGGGISHVTTSRVSAFISLIINNNNYLVCPSSMPHHTPLVHINLDSQFPGREKKKEKKKEDSDINMCFSHAQNTSQAKAPANTLPVPSFSGCIHMNAPALVLSLTFSPLALPRFCQCRLRTVSAAAIARGSQTSIYLT